MFTNAIQTLVVSGERFHDERLMDDFEYLYDVIDNGLSSYSTFQYFLPAIPFVLSLFMGLEYQKWKKRVTLGSLPPS